MLFTHVLRYVAQFAFTLRILRFALIYVLITYGWPRAFFLAANNKVIGNRAKLPKKTFRLHSFATTLEKFSIKNKLLCSGLECVCVFIVLLLLWHLEYE